MIIITVAFWGGVDCPQETRDIVRKKVEKLAVEKGLEVRPRPDHKIHLQIIRKKKDGIGFYREVQGILDKANEKTAFHEIAKIVIWDHYRASILEAKSLMEELYRDDIAACGADNRRHSGGTLYGAWNYVTGKVVRLGYGLGHKLPEPRGEWTVIKVPYPYSN